MRAALMWTINDFPAYGMVSGWSMHGKLACPYCMENNKAFTLTNGGKASFFDCHRHLLPSNHRYRKNKNDLFVGRVEKDVAPPHLSSEELFDVVSEYGDIVFRLQSGKQKFPGFGLTYNWVKRSIFWELPYWKPIFSAITFMSCTLKRTCLRTFSHRHGYEGEDKGQHQG
jgi:hypothetical protein